MKKLTLTNKILYGVAALFLFWLGDWMGNTYQLTEGTATRKITAAVDVVSFMAHPFRLSFMPFSLLCGLGAVALAALIVVCVVFSKHRLMPQKEYGSARWGNETDIAPFVDADPQNNLPLTATEKLSLAPRMKVTPDDNYNRNKNLLVIGPSGSGKSRGVAKPEMLEFNSNYIVTDPKGGATRS